MPLTKAQIIEIQAAARHNTLKLMREAEEQKDFKKQVAEEVKAAMKPQPKVESVEEVKTEESVGESVKTAKKGK